MGRRAKQACNDNYNATMPDDQPRTCTTLRHYAYQECYVAGDWRMQLHCARWYQCFPDATRCHDYEREPGSDDEPAGVMVAGA